MIVLENKNETSQIFLVGVIQPINIIITLILTILGLFGHVCTILVYSKAKFRINSYHVYLLCLAINDCLFLLIHLIEDVIRSWQETFLMVSYNDENSNNNNNNNFNLNDLEYLSKHIKISIINLLNITDNYELTCKMINYLRYVLRFISAHTIVAFTIQRLIIVSRPLSNRFKNKKSAWFIVTMIVFISILFNLWIPFLFQIKTNELNLSYCDINNDYEIIYYYFTLIYICLIMLIPILIIFLSNSFTLNITLQAYKLDKLNNNSANLNYNFARQPKKAYYSTFNECAIIQFNNRLEKQKTYSTKITRTLVLISLLFAILNLPYFIAWCFNFHIKNDTKNFYTVIALKITELFYLSNYSIQFYINLFTSNVFRNQIRYICNYKLFNLFY